MPHHELERGGAPDSAQVSQQGIRDKQEEEHNEKELVPERKELPNSLDHSPGNCYWETKKSILFRVSVF